MDSDEGKTNLPFGLNFISINILNITQKLVKLNVDTINERHSVSNAEWALCDLYSLPRVINEDETGTIIMLNAKDATYNTKMFGASINTCRMKGF